MSILPPRATATDPWRERAACMGHPDLFAPGEDKPLTEAQIAQAVALCGVCPVRLQCRGEGARERGRQGQVWAGHFYGNPAPDNGEEGRRISVYREGLNDVQMGRELHLSPAGVRHWRMIHNLPPNTAGRPIPVEEAEERAERIRLAVQRYRSGDSVREIAEQVGVSGRTVSRWIQEAVS